MSPNADPFVTSLCHYLGDSLGIPVELIDGIPWQERQGLLDVGRIDLAWLCGLPYVERIDAGTAPIELLVAPVMRGPRYRSRPVYFSDVIVGRDSPATSFSALRGASWAYNEKHSHSGYQVVRYHLAQMGETGRFFGKVVESGSHLKSLEMVILGEVDASAIDSTVLEIEVDRQPELTSRIRTIDTIGPSPIPPWVISKALSPRLAAALKRAMVSVHRDPVATAFMAEGRTARFVEVSDADYDPIRRMSSMAAGVEL